MLHQSSCEFSFISFVYPHSFYRGTKTCFIWFCWANGSFIFCPLQSKIPRVIKLLHAIFYLFLLIQIPLMLSCIYISSYKLLLYNIPLYVFIIFIFIWKTLYMSKTSSFYWYSHFYGLHFYWVYELSTCFSGSSQRHLTKLYAEFFLQGLLARS